MVKVPAAQPAPRVPRSRRDDRYETGHQAGEKRATAGYVVSIQDSYDTVTVDVLDEKLTGVIPLGEMPPVGAICEVEARGDLLVIPIWYPGPEQPEWVQDPDFTAATLPPRATFPELDFYNTYSAGNPTPAFAGDTVANYERARLELDARIADLWDASTIDPEDGFIFDGAGDPTFPGTSDSIHEWSIRFHTAVGDIFDDWWDNAVSAIHSGYAVETRCPNLEIYESGPGIEWESTHAKAVGANIRVTMRYWQDGVPLTSTNATVTTPIVTLTVYVYTLAAGNNRLVAPQEKRLIHTDTIPRTVSAGGTGPKVVTMDVVLTEYELRDWAYGNGLMFYSLFNQPERPQLTHLASHSELAAVSYNARVEIDMGASTWTVRPPRWRSIP